MFTLWLLCSLSTVKRAAPANSNATPEAVALFNRIATLQKIGIMYGHQDDLVYGFSHGYESGSSDIKDLVGDYPAVVGFELGHIEMGDEQSLDGVKFADIRTEVIRFYNLGGIVTISWHQDNPLTKGDAWDTSSSQVVSQILPGGNLHDEYLTRLTRLADFFLTLKDDKDVLIPFLFRPFHEHTGNWFWWGRDFCTDEQYIQLWQLTVKFLRDKGLNNILFQYNTDHVSSLDDYLRGYPGNDYIDMLTVDVYARDDTFFSDIPDILGWVSASAQERGKLAAFAETGEYSSDPTWWSAGLLDVFTKIRLLGYEISYVLTWRDETGLSPVGPAVGSSTAADFLTFSEDSLTLFLSDIQPIAVLKYEIVDDLTTGILPFWEKYSQDPAGGFYGELANDGTPTNGAAKGGILNSRIIWAFSSAYRLLGARKYKTLADRAADYFLTHFIDKNDGGSYWEVNADGTPSDTSKTAFAISYAIYGIAEHVRATNNQTTLDAALSLYKYVEENLRDSKNGGYFDSDDGTSKSSNGNMHILEAYTNLLRVYQNSALTDDLGSIITVVAEKVMDQSRWHENLEFHVNWEPTELATSYGHDLELSWLLCEGAEVLGDSNVLANMIEIAKNIDRVQVDEGINNEGGVRYTLTENSFEWWPQAEAINAFLNLYRLTGDSSYVDLASRTWTFIKTKFIDYEYGEWYSGVSADGVVDKTRVKAGIWRCPYHTSRVGFRVLEFLSK